MRESWWPDFRGAAVLIVASGPSAEAVPLAEAKGKSCFVAINESWRLCPWADVLYGCDAAWWRKRHGVPAFTGVRISQDKSARNLFPDVNFISCRRGVHRIILDDTGQVGDGGTSLLQAINFVLRAGPPRAIGLVGADMCLDYGVHWHGPHGDGLNNPKPHTIARWRAAVDGIADQLKELGVEMFNLSSISTLKNYPKVTLRDFLAA